MTERSTFSRRFAAEGLEARLYLAAVSSGWDGPGLGSADLTYYIGAIPGYLDAGQVRAALVTAMDAWEQAVDVTFAPTTTPGLANSIDFTFAPIDGANGTLAYAYFPDDVNGARVAGDIRFDTSERWEIGNQLGGAAVDLTLVAAHELGHALGLDHSRDGSGVMAASVSALQQFRGLDPHDVDSALALYAPALSRNDEVPTPVAQAPTLPAVPDVDVTTDSSPTEPVRPPRRWWPADHFHVTVWTIHWRLSASDTGYQFTAPTAFWVRLPRWF